MKVIIIYKFYHLILKIILKKFCSGTADTILDKQTLAKSVFINLDESEHIYLQTNIITELQATCISRNVIDRSG